MSFQSILFNRDADSDACPAQPGFFGDLQLDQIVASLIEGREEYDLAPLFYTPLHEVEAVRDRHHVFRDLERAEIRDAIDAFAGGMRRVRECLALRDTLHYRLQKQRWFLESGAAYCASVQAFDEQLSTLAPESSGLVALRDYIAEYARSEAFTSLCTETHKVIEDLAAVSYAVHIKGARIRVDRYDGEPDMSEEVAQTFAKFKQGAGSDHRVRFRDHSDMNHVEAQILDLVARLHPETFRGLDAYCSHHANYVDATIGRFDREVQFYLAHLDYCRRLKNGGVVFSYPRVSARSKEELVRDACDLALATKLLSEGQRVVCNDYHLTEPERILVVSGPNNGGKTTFARMFGQLHYLAALGLPVAGSEVRLFLPDQVFTHFEREESIATLRGKFEDELFRIHEILQHATAGSVLVMNESFASTTLRDALLVGTEVIREIIDLDVLCVYVTFVDELASLGDSTVSMMSTVDPEDPAVRTFKVVRQPADGLAYAAAIAEKYGLTYDSLRTRIAR